MNLQVNKNTLINIINKFKNINFVDATKILMDKTVIKDTKLFIDSLQNIISYDKEIISPKILLSAFFITDFHNEVLSETKNDIDTFILEKSSYILNETKELNITNKINILKYISELNKYSHYFDQWKKKDLDSQLQIYKEMYYQSNLSEDIKRKIESLIGEEKTNELLAINITEKESKMLSDNIEKTLKKAFWDILEQDFKNNNYSQVSSIIKDIKSYFCKINSSLENKINEYLDDEFVSMYIETQNFEQLFETLKFCLIELKKLDAPFYDKQNEEFQNLNQNTPNFILLLSFLLERLDYISSLKNKLLRNI